MPNHHAVLLQGASLEESGYAPLLQNEKSEMEIVRFETLAIGDVRKIIQSAYATSLSALTKIIVIEAKNIAIEAQQALLKIFEEPPATTQFIVVLISLEGLLPTLLSRLNQPSGQSIIKRTSNPLFTMFQSSNYAGRLEWIARITKDKDTEQIDSLQAGVVWVLSGNPLPKDAAKLAYCVSQMNVRGASKKMLLEEIALTLPVVTHNG